MSGQRAAFAWHGETYDGLWSDDEPFGALFWRYGSPRLCAYETPVIAAHFLADGEDEGTLSSVAVVDLRTGVAVAQWDDETAAGYVSDPWEAVKELSVIETTGYVRKELAPAREGTTE